VRILFALFVGTAGIVGYALAPLSMPMRLLYGLVALPIALPPESFTGGYTINFIGIAAGDRTLGDRPSAAASQSRRSDRLAGLSGP
jgi:hypothetical protein